MAPLEVTPQNTEPLSHRASTWAVRRAALTELLKLVMDMDQEGAPHSRECECEVCCHYVRAHALMDRYHALYFELNEKPEARS